MAAEGLEYRRRRRTEATDEDNKCEETTAVLKIGIQHGCIHDESLLMVTNVEKMAAVLKVTNQCDSIHDGIGIVAENDKCEEHAAVLKSNDKN